MKNTNTKFKRIVTFKDHVGELTATYRRTSVLKTSISSSEDAYDFIYPYFDEIMDDHEEAKVIHVNNYNKVVNVHHLTVGSDVGTLIPIKSILRNALILNVKGILLIHNHPSGNLKPSKSDIEISKKLSKACKLMDLNLLDSLILTRESYYSLSDHGDL